MRLPRVSTRRFLVLPVIATIFATAGGVVTWWLTRAGSLSPGPPEALALPVPDGQEVTDLAIDPAGTMLAYAAVVEGRSRLVLRRFDSFTEELIPGTDGASQPFFAPDGERLAYFAEGMLKTVQIDGSQAIDVCSVPGATAGGTWTVDGHLIYAPLGGQGLVRVAADGGRPVPLTRLDDQGTEVAHGWPHALPDGRSIVFTIGRTGRSPLLSLLSLETGEQRSLVPADGGASYVTSGHVVYARQGEVFALPIEAETLSMRGAPRVVANAVTSSAAGYWRLGRSKLVAARDSTLVYAPADEDASDTTLVWVDRGGEITSLDDVAAPHQTPRLSPDGQHIVVAVHAGPFSRDLWLYDHGTGTRRRVTENAGDNHSPLWSPDGRRIAFASSRDGPQRIYSIPTTGDGEPEILLFGDGRAPGSWSADGNTLFFHEVRPARARNIWTWSAGAAESSRLVATTANERAPALSPDGRWLAYTSDHEAGDQIYVQTYPSGGSRQRISPIGGTEPVWARDGSELFYRRGTEVHALEFDSGMGVATSSTLLLDGPFMADPDGNLPSYDVDTDGSRLLMLRSGGRVDVLRVLRNWVPVVFPAEEDR